MSYYEIQLIKKLYELIKVTKNMTKVISEIQKVSSTRSTPYKAKNLT